jgi:hypothetical protein
MVSRYSEVVPQPLQSIHIFVPRFRLRRDNLFILSVAEGQVVHAFSFLPLALAAVSVLNLILISGAPRGSPRIIPRMSYSICVRAT